MWSTLEGEPNRELNTWFWQGQDCLGRRATSKTYTMKQAVASSPKVNLKCMGRKMASLLDSQSMVSLVQQGYFDRNIKPKPGPSRGPEATSHNLFDLKGANGGKMSITRYFKMDIAFLGLKVPRVEFLVVKDPSDLLETKKTKLPSIIRWNLIRLTYQEFIKKHPIEAFKIFQCPWNMDPLLFLQLCVYCYTDIRPAVVSGVKESDCVYTKSITTHMDGGVVYKKHQNFNNLLGGPVGTVKIGMDKEPTCIPGNCMLTVLGNTSKII